MFHDKQPQHGEKDPDGTYFYHSPSTFVGNEQPKSGGLLLARYRRYGDTHRVVIVKFERQEGADHEEVLLSGPTFFGWVSALDENFVYEGEPQ